MDNDIRVVTDKEVYLLASPAVSKSETEIVFRNWLRTGGLTGPDITDAINIVKSEDVYLPMSVTSVESWGNWSLLQGTFQKREFDRDQRQYERDYLVYQAEEKKHHAAKERGESYTLPPMPRAPIREDYFEYFPESGEYTTSFKGILRGFGAEDLGRATGLLNDLSTALDQLLRHGFPAAAPTADAPAPINRNVLNTLVDEYVSDRGIDWVKDQAKKYEKAKKLEISGVNYRRECNIVFLPVRVIEYSYAGKNYIAVSDPIRNEYMLGTPPAAAKVAAPPPPAAKSKTGLMAIAGGAAVLLIVLGVVLLTHSGKHQSASTASVPAAAPAQPSSASNTPPAATAATTPSNNTSATPPAATSAADQAAAQQAAAQQAAAQQAAQQAAAEKAAEDAAAAKAAQEAAAEQAAQDAAAAQAAQEAAAAQAAQAAADEKASQDAAAAKAEQQEAADKAAQQAAIQKAAQDAAAAQAAKDAAAAQQAQDAQEAQEAAAARAAQQAATAQAAQSAAGAANVTAPPALDDNANDLTAAANASPAAPPAAAATAAPAQPAANAKPDKKAAKAAAAKEQPAPPAPKPEGPTGKNYAAFVAGKLRLPEGGDSASSGNDLGYYDLGVAAQNAGNTDAARTYYQLSLQHSQTNSPPSVCSPRHGATYQPQLCHGIVLPGRASRALASLPGG